MYKLDGKMLHRNIALLFLMLLSFAFLTANTQFAEFVNNRISRGELNRDFREDIYRDVYNHTAFDLKVLVAEKFSGEENRFGIRDYDLYYRRYHPHLSADEFDTTVNYNTLEKVYRTHFRGRDRYFIAVLEEDSSRMVYEVNHQPNLVRILNDAVAKQGMEFVVSKIIYPEQLEQMQDYLPPVLPSTLVSVVNEAQNLTLSLEESQRARVIAEERETKADGLRKLMFIIFILFFAVLVVVLIALLRVHSRLKRVKKGWEVHKKKTPKEIKGNLTTANQAELKNRELFQGEIKKLIYTLKAIEDKSKGANSQMQQEKKTMQATIDEQAGKLAFYEQSINKYEAELHTLRELGQHYLEVREAAGKVLYPKKPKEQVTPADLKFVIEELAKETEKRNGRIRTKEEEIVRLKENIATVSAETAAVREAFGIGDTPLKDYISAIIAGKEYQVIAQKEKRKQNIAANEQRLMKTNEQLRQDNASKKAMIGNQKKKLNAYEQTLKKSEVELHNLRALEEQYLDVREVAGKILVPKKLSEEVTANDLRFVIEELARETERRNMIMRTMKQELEGLKRELAEYKEFEQAKVNAFLENRAVLKEIAQKFDAMLEQVKKMIGTDTSLTRSVDTVDLEEVITQYRQEIELICKFMQTNHSEVPFEERNLEDK